MSNLTSVILPVYNQADFIEYVVNEFMAALNRLPDDFEIILVPNNCSDKSYEVCDSLTAHDRVRSIHLQEGGWGRAVRAGLDAARGDMLTYTNSARTKGETLALLISYARKYDGVLVKTNRRVRDNAVRRFGSLLFNVECRALFDLATWDVNGTPKVFSRSLNLLPYLNSNDDLLDTELLAITSKRGYPILEVPLISSERLGGKSTTGVGSALKMYLGALQLGLRLDLGAE